MSSKAQKAVEEVMADIPEPQFLIRHTALQNTINVLVKLPYGDPVPNGNGVVVGDVINELRGAALAEPEPDGE